MRNSKRARWRQRLGQLTGVSLGLVCLAFLLLPGMRQFHARGPMNTGHENLECVDCHQNAPGTTRQQIQANVRFWLGLRSKPATLGLERVGNQTCLECHDRPNDRHPVFRFNEPRFREARAKLNPQECLSCHQEHRGLRVSQSQEFCETCHQDLILKNDPISIPHQTLVKESKWSTCLGCHDFHGNHAMDTPVDVEKSFDLKDRQAYFRGEKSSPYSDQKFFVAKRKGEENE